ncbi:MAG TPA: hypothetical protein VGC91_07275 [Pyrinomonadaceae bacterium]|jgi:hypothetical protein
MNEIQLETIKIRLEGIRQAITRSRFTFLVSIITSVAIFVTAWNAYLSWDGGFVKQPHWSHDDHFESLERAKRLKDLENEFKIAQSDLAQAKVDPQDVSELKINPAQLTEVTDHAQKELISEWVRNRTITIGLLGIRVSVDDLPVLGSLSLGIISIWLFYSVRRENRAIGTLFRDVYRIKDWHVRYMVYQGVVHNLVLLDYGRGNQPLVDFKKEAGDGGKEHPLLRGALIALFYLPPFSILFVIVMDVMTLFYWESPFRPSHQPLWRLLYPKDWVKVSFMEFVALALLFSAIFLCRGVRRYLRATETLVKEYRKELKKSMGQRFNE